MKLRIQIKELQEEAESLKSVIKEDQQERIEKLELFLETILEVKQAAFKRVMKDHYEQFIAEQEVLKKLTKEKCLPTGWP